MLEDVTAQDRVERAGQPVELVERAFPEPPGVGRKPLARRRHELRRDGDAEGGELRPTFTGQPRNDGGSAAPGMFQLIRGSRPGLDYPGIEVTPPDSKSTPLNFS